jgi:hypothetical protein
MLLAVTLATLLLAAPAPAAPARKPSSQALAAAAPAPAPAPITPQDWAAWNRARAKQGLLPRKPPQRTARVAPAPAPATLPAASRARGKRGRALVLAAAAAPLSPALDAVLDPVAPAEQLVTPLHALLAGLDRGGAPAARVEVDGAGLGATLRGLRAAVAVVARTGALSVALESGVLADDGR